MDPNYMGPFYCGKCDYPFSKDTEWEDHTPDCTGDMSWKDQA